ncbi:MAG: PHP domain-containing protein [Clostridiaceae bacterium]|nr:PHP domain-containing protein [Clostridiaceae bacterium]
MSRTDFLQPDEFKTSSAFSVSLHTESAHAAEHLCDIIADGACDLHMHSMCSDGSESAAQLIERAMRNGLRTISLTDHDNFNGVKEIKLIESKLRQLGVKTPVIVPGIEVSTQGLNQELHLLAYFPFGGYEAIRNIVEQSQISRDERNRKMCAVLTEHGLPVSYEELRAEGGSIVGRVHMANILVRKGYAGSTDEAFHSWLSSSAPYYVRREIADIEDVIVSVLEAGGVPVLAHPALYGWTGRNDDLLYNNLKYLREKGLIGVETVSGQHTRIQRKELATVTHELGLLATCGSDYHGTNKVNVQMFTAEQDFSEFL